MHQRDPRSPSARVVVFLRGILRRRFIRADENRDRDSRSRDPRMLTISRNLLDRLVAREPRQRLLRGSQRGRERGAEKNKLSRKRGCSLVAIMDRRSSAVLRGPPLITAHNRGFHQKVSQVRIHTPPPRPRGRGRGQRRGVLANSDTGYPLRISAGRILSYQSLLASSPATRLSPPPNRRHPPFVADALSGHLSIHRLDVRGHESSVNACQVPRERRN